LDTKEIKQIIELIRRYDLTEFEVEREGLKLRIHRNSSKEKLSGNYVAESSNMSEPAQMQRPEKHSETESYSVVAPQIKKEDDKSVYILKSPIVGTFYRSSAPENPRLVEAGSKVGPTTIVAIIEAMKVMNEIQADASGTVVEILVENGQSVEYGQPLMKIALN
jgi:acetyl-CoA carboxylase biotin carboxyl carrier protein